MAICSRSAHHHRTLHLHSLLAVSSTLELSRTNQPTHQRFFLLRLASPLQSTTGKATSTSFSGDYYYSSCFSIDRWPYCCSPFYPTFSNFFQFCILPPFTPPCDDPEIVLSDHDTRRFGFVAQQWSSFRRTQQQQYFGWSTLSRTGLFYNATGPSNSRMVGPT